MPRHRGSGLVLFLPLLLLHVQLVHAGAGSSYVCPPYNAAKPPYVFEDEPAWGKSIMRRHLLETYNNTCKEQTCGLHAGLSNMIEAYKSADQVLVIDISRWERVNNGIGNILWLWTFPLTHSLLAGRAAFVKRNTFDCGRDCLFDPGDYFGAVGNVQWKWTREAECHVQAAMAARGVAERVFTVLVEGGNPDDLAGFKDMTTGEVFRGKFITLDFLRHPAVTPHPWVRLQFEAAYGFETSSEMNGLYRVLTNIDPTQLREPTPGEKEAMRAVARRACPDAADGVQLEVSEDCALGTFVYPLPKLQRLLVPHLPVVDAVRGACGSVVGIHFRSGYADIAADPPWKALAEKGLPPGVTHREVLRRAWGALHNLTAPCPQRCHLGKAPNPDGAYTTDPAPGCKPVGLGDGELCMDWKNNERTLASVTTLRAELLKQMLLDDDAGSAGRTGAAPAPGQAADADAGRPTNFSLAHEEVGHAFGVVPAALTAAARDAQRFAWGRRAQCSSSPEQEPWAVYVASDAPIVVAVAEASPSLRGRAFTAGKESGSIGNVWMQALCSDENLRENHGVPGHDCISSKAELDPGGVWSRSVVDFFLLTQVDKMYSLGISSFAGAALRHSLRGGGNHVGVWDFNTQVTVDGNYSREIRPDKEWASERWRQVTGAMAWLQAAGLGGIGI